MEEPTSGGMYDTELRCAGLMKDLASGSMDDTDLHRMAAWMRNSSEDGMDITELLWAG